MKNKKQVKPKWFNGVIYEKGTTVTNPFSGEEFELNNIELSIYDFVIGGNAVLEQIFDREPEIAVNEKTQDLISDVHKGLDWFKVNNPEAYMVLLD
jgi:hypothetical protein